MTALAARQETLRLIDEVPDDEMPRLLVLVQSFSKANQKVADHAESQATDDDHSAFEEAFGIWKDRTASDSSADDRKARIHSVLAETAGMWADREDMKDVDAYVRKLRRGRRFDI